MTSALRTTQSFLQLTAPCSLSPATASVNPKQNYSVPGLSVLSPSSSPNTSPRTFPILSCRISSLLENLWLPLQISTPPRQASHPHRPGSVSQAQCSESRGSWWMVVSREDRGATDTPCSTQASQHPGAGGGEEKLLQPQTCDFYADRVTRSTPNQGLQFHGSHCPRCW